MKNWLKVFWVFIVMLLLYLFRNLWFGLIKKAYNFLVSKITIWGLLLLIALVILLLYRIFKKYRFRQLMHILLIILYVYFGVYIYFNIDRVWDYLYACVGTSLTVVGFFVIIGMFLLFLFRILPIDVDEM